ncbi:coiled-coil domain-containing protein 115 [Pectinophora gossypiella]|uniref:Vacuolar ATPase assembly protein VMA22 n=1 Tax=Pectinophora gossypiella TaxID=13191 RepID=A0A1E1WGA4_PECGO|nr:coiled-coil domain-containing protein 115 [Pectinophora gossypiella]
MGGKIRDTGAPDRDSVCELLDKLTLKQLHLIEDKIRCEMNIETNINNGSFQLAKSRYIMGHSAITATKLPMENSPEFSASTVCETTEEDGVMQLKAVKSETEDTVNPVRWFGVLVPQNLHAAQGIFQNAINYVVECVNIQLQLNENCNNIATLKQYKGTLRST